MITNNPFVELSIYIAPGVMQVFVIIMFMLVVVGTLIDVVHKQSARYFFENWQKSKNRGANQVSGPEVASMAVKTLACEVLTSSEFCNVRRRLAHLLTMYGFVAYVIATAVMVFKYPDAANPTPEFWPLLWHIGALMVCIGGYWFWFFIRVDVAAEGHSPFRIVRADLFILSLLASTTLGLLWSWLQTSAIGWFVFGLYVIATMILFGSVPWSKFAHMFFKPAAALQKRVAEADGSRGNLPAPADKPETFGKPRGLPQNY